MESNQCRFITEQGERCKLSATGDFKCCHIHEGGKRKTKKNYEKQNVKNSESKQELETQKKSNDIIHNTNEVKSTNEKPHKKSLTPNPKTEKVLEPEKSLTPNPKQTHTVKEKKISKSNKNVENS